VRGSPIGPSWAHKGFCSPCSFPHGWFLCCSLAWGFSAFLGDASLIYVIETATYAPWVGALMAVREMEHRHSVFSCFLLRGGKEAPGRS
jgi:hypothetical protein